MTKEVNDTGQAFHTAGILCCSSRRSLSPAARNARHDKESAGDEQPQAMNALNA
jgi:hypothetical protein